MPSIDVTTQPSPLFHEPSLSKSPTFSLHPLEAPRLMRPAATDERRLMPPPLPPKRGDGSNNSSQEFGPFVSAQDDDDPRQRSSSFNASILQRQRYSAVPTDHLRRLSEGRSGSAENMAGTSASGHPRLPHSHTMSELPPHALSNDSGYHTPPSARHYTHTSPPWPPNQTMQWPSHIAPSSGRGPLSPPSALIGPGDRVPVNQRLTVDIGHFEPEPQTPELMIAPFSMHQFRHSSASPSRDPHHSMPARTTPQTPEEGE